MMFNTFLKINLWIGSSPIANSKPGVETPPEYFIVSWIIALGVLLLFASIFVGSIVYTVIRSWKSSPKPKKNKNKKNIDK